MLKNILIILFFINLTISGQTPTCNSAKDSLYVNSNKDSIYTLPSVYNGLVAWWNSKTAFTTGSNITSLYDRSRHGNSASQSNATYQPEMTDTMMVFDGNDDRLINSSSDLNPYTNFFTVSVWIKIVNYTSIFKYVISKGGGGLSGWSIALSGGHYAIVEFYDGSGTRSNAPYYVSLNDNNWHNIVAIHNSDFYTYIYVDGNFRNKSILPFYGNISSIYNLHIGAFCIPQNYFEGGIDDIRIYNRALETYEIEYLYNNPISKFNLK